MGILKMSEDFLKDAWSDHSRLWEKNTWVYPVISRRAKGLSIGVNLNPDKRCSFDCVYCQVDRSIPGSNRRLDIEAMTKEIELIIQEYEKNGLTSFSNFKLIEESKRQIKDICLSGDGESTLIKEFPAVCERLLEIQHKYSKYNLKLTLITNSTRLDQEYVREGLRYLTQTNGEIWAKLDAGTEEWFQKVNISPYPLEVIQRNIELTVKDFPTRIQTMWCEVDGISPSPEEVRQYIERVKRIYHHHSKNLLEVQLYSVVRNTARPHVLPISKSFMEDVSREIQSQIDVPVGIY